jgi:hypothetical protein
MAGVPDEQDPPGVIDGSTETDGNSSNSCPTTARSRAICAAIPTRATLRLAGENLFWGQGATAPERRGQGPTAPITHWPVPGIRVLAVGKAGEQERSAGDAGDRRADQDQRIEP